MIKLLAGLNIAAVLMITPVSAAGLVAHASGVQGKVLVNQGKGFMALLEASTLNEGDQVFVGEGAHVVLTYPKQKCSVEVSSARSLKIGKIAPCKAGETLAMVEGEFISPVNGGLYGSALATEFSGGTLLAAGGLALATTGGLAYIMLSEPHKGTCAAAASACP